MTAIKRENLLWGKCYHLGCLRMSDWLCIVVAGSSEIIQFEWLALTSFLPCSWPSFTSWLCSISPSLPLGRATLPSLVRTYGSLGKSVYLPVFTPTQITLSKHSCHYKEISSSLISCSVQTVSCYLCMPFFWLSVQWDGNVETVKLYWHKISLYPNFLHLECKT